jgi:hypothetical protein
VGQLAVTRVSPALGRLDTMVMFGNNCGIFGSRRRRPWLLRRFKSITRPGAKILAAGTDPYTTDNPEHLATTSRTGGAAGWRPTPDRRPLRLLHDAVVRLPARVAQ